MNDTVNVTIFVLLDDLMHEHGHRTDVWAGASDSEVLTVAVVAAAQFGNHHERALCVLRGMHYLSGTLSLSRFNRRLHALADWLTLALDGLGEAFAAEAAFALDSVPVPVCHRVSAGRCTKVCGRAYCGYCAAKEERFFGWRLHLVCTNAGVPVAFELLPASYHDLTPLYELTANLPTGSRVYGDKGYNSADDEAWLDGEWGIALVPVRRKNMTPNTKAQRAELRRMRAAVEGANSQLVAWGVQRLHARTIAGVAIKVLASLLALAVVNAL